MKKKLLAALLAVAFALSLAGCGSKTAETNPAPAPSESVTPENTLELESTAVTLDRATATENACEDIGVTFYLPAAYDEAKGVVDLSSDGISCGEGVYFASCDYHGFTMDWYNETFGGDDYSDEDVQKYYDSTVNLFTLLGIDGGRGASEAAEAYNEAYGEELVSAEDLTELKKSGDITYFRVADDAENVKNLEGEFVDEYMALAAYTDAVLDAAEFYEPASIFSGIDGQQVSFVAKDINGNTVTSDELFSQYDVTMVNVWATWCHWCLVELPELQEINNRLADKNCAIIGILGDGTDEETIALGKSQLAEAGCTYLCLLPFDGWEDIFPMTAGWPTSFFFDRTGKMIAEPTVGAAVDEYEDKIDSLLAGGDAGTANAAASSESAYRIFVVDTAGNAIEGAMVQFCTADTCKVAATDASGCAAFADPEGVYEVHVLKAPDGYKPNETLYHTSETYGDLTIVLEKA